jgi:hypothetical protein
VAFYDDPGEVPTPRALSDRDGYLPALRLEVVPQGCRQRRGHVPGEHLIVLLRGEGNEVGVRSLPIHLQHVGTMGDVLEAASVLARLVPWPRSRRRSSMIGNGLVGTVGQTTWRLGVSPREYPELEAGTRAPTFETWDRICKLFGWPQTFTNGS